MSSDGGLTFTPISLTVNENDLPPVEVNLLATHPQDPNMVYAVHAGFPKTTVIRSNDGGTSWFAVRELSDIPDSLVIDSSTGRIMLASPLDGLLTSDDDGRSWSVIERPKKTYGLDACHTARTGRSGHVSVKTQSGW